MGERTSYENGTFNWVELATPDPDGARDFYTGLFGWDSESRPGGHGERLVFSKDGKRVSALDKMGERQPVPAWLSYIAVDDLDATASQATDLGASILMGPFEAGSAGRMAVIADPTDAVVALWEAGEQIGAELVNDIGALCMNQLNTSDPERAQAFYLKLFGWRIEEMPSDLQTYWGLFRGEAEESLNGGMMALPEGDPVSHWFVYFTVENADDAVARIEELGGSILVQPMEIQAGRIAVAADPQGAPFALFEGDVHP